jgi:3-oxoacyl-[acyl-carrier protein] reductase
MPQDGAGHPAGGLPRLRLDGRVDLGLAGCRVLVSGGAGGIGAAICRAFGGEGARVAVGYRTSTRGAEALAGELGGVALPADLTDPGQADRLVGAAAEALGGLDVVVACAGRWPAQDVPVWDMTVERWRETLDANLTATFLTARAFCRLVHGRPAGGRPPCLVLIGSTAGSFGEAGHADYAAAKSAIGGGLLLSLKNEVVRLHPGARVNAVAPGWTVTPMTRDRLDPAAVAVATSTMPLRKTATEADVAAAVLWLASHRAAGHVTGQLLTVAGGMEGRLLHDPGDAGQGSGSPV